MTERNSGLQRLHKTCRVIIWVTAAVIFGPLILFGLLASLTNPQGVGLPTLFTVAPVFLLAAAWRKWKES